MIKPTLFTLFFALLSFYAVAQNVDLSRISTEEGLSVGHVTDIIQDDVGFIWIGTEMGINKFDGYEIKSIKGPDGILERAHVVDLHNDKEGNVWIGTRKLGIFCFDTNSGEIKHITWPKNEENKKKIAFFISIANKEDGTTLIANHNQIFELSSNKKTLQSVVKLDSVIAKKEIIEQIYINNSIIFITTSKKLFIYDLINKKLKAVQFPNSAISKSYKHKKPVYISNNTLWVGTINGLYSLPLSKIYEFMAVENYSLSFNHEVINLAIWGIIHNDNSLHLATSNGMYLFDDDKKLKKLWQFSSSKYQLTDNTIYKLLIDKNQNIWATSLSEGVYYWRPSTGKFVNVYSRNNEVKISNNVVWSFSKSDENTLWIGTENGLNEMNLTNFEINSYLVSEKEKADSINYIFRYNDDLLLVTDSGLKYFDPISKKLKPIKLLKDSDSKILKSWMMGAHLDSFGFLWFVSETGYYKFELKTANLQKFEIPETGVAAGDTHRFLGQLPNKNMMLFSTQGQLWGINLLSHSTSLIYETPIEKQGRLFEVDSWVIDKNNILWIAFMGDSLVGLNADDFTLIYRLTSPTDLKDNIIYGLQTDIEGDIWFSSHTGIYHLRLDSMFIEHFSIQDGLVSNEFNEGAYLKINDDLLVYGSPTGITLFSPSKLEPKQHILPKVEFSDISLLSPTTGKRNISLFTDKLTLNHDDIGLELRFSTLEYERQKAVKYEFWLDGADKWTYPLSDINSMQFGKLAPGGYEFNVRAQSPFTGEVGNISKLKVIVRYAPWNSPIAYLLYLGILITLLYFWQRNRSSHIKELTQAHLEMRQSHDQMVMAKQSAEQANNAKSVFLANISHELRTPMHSILGFSKLGLKILDNDVSQLQKDKLIRYSNNINLSGKRLLVLINNLLDIEKLTSGKMQFIPTKIDFITILDSALSEMEAYIQDNKTQVEIKKKESVETQIWVDKNLMIQVLVNLLSNAVKFSPEQGMVTIEINDLYENNDHETQECYIEVKVIDQGPGIPEHELNSIFEHFVQSSTTKAGTGGTGLGLAISQNIMNLHKSKITVSNIEGAGACFSFILNKTAFDI